MMIGAKIVLNTVMDAARDELAGLAGASWMMSLPQRRNAYGAHPAGRARPGLPADSGPGLVAVTFGSNAVSATARVLLPVRWEAVEPGDQFTILLDGDITLAPASAQGSSSLTLAGVCRMPPGTLTAGDREQARLQVIEVSREFITSVARIVTRATDVGPEQEPLGQAWSWLTRPPGTP